ncbi:MAG: hypothetical protein JO332_19580 [Planctomycetaceae bacterium]|nr:hypothetical protein [Planctomycetaceae bacterium]
MRGLTLFSVALLIALVSCKAKKPLTVDPTATADLPRESAIQKLREILPTTDYVYCTAPKWSLKQSEITTWTVENDAIGIDHGKGNKLRLAFSDMTDVKVDLSGKYYYVRVFTVVQTDRDKPHFEFLFRIEDRAKQVAELLLSLKKK